MPRISIELDSETYGRLIQEAVQERRDIIGQAEVLIMLELGTYPRQQRGQQKMMTPATAGR